MRISPSGREYAESVRPSGLLGPAEFSRCRTWRYTLERETAHAAETHSGLHRRVVFIGLNPSTADEVTNDRTVRRCLGFATRWGFEEMVMLNLFGYRSTDPRGLRTATDAVGPQNDRWIAAEAATADLVVCCWGVHGKFRGRGEDVTNALQELSLPLHTLALSREGHPRHPLYLRADLDPQLWSGYA